MSTKEVRNLAPYRSYIIRISFAFFLAIFFWRYYSHILPHQLRNPELINVGFDPIYFIFYIFNIGDILTNEYYSSIFTLLLLFFTIYPIINPYKRVFLIIYAVLYLTYFIVLNTYLTFHAHYMSCILLLNVCFTFKKNVNFNLMWEFMRYFVCWVYFSAFIWKIINGSVFQPSYGLEIIKTSQASFIYSNPNSFWSEFYFFFISNPILTSVGTSAIFLLEAIFGLGFFTKKVDGILLVSIFIIHLTIYLFVDTLFIEQCILFVVFISKETWRKIDRKSRLLFKTYNLNPIKI